MVSKSVNTVLQVCEVMLSERQPTAATTANRAPHSHLPDLILCSSNGTTDFVSTAFCSLLIRKIQIHENAAVIHSIAGET